MPPPRSDSGMPADELPVVAPTRTPAPGTPLYVHVPFCVVKCTYCDFFSVASRPEDDFTDDVEALLAEAAARAPREPTSVFLGGGTPSFLPEELLRRLLRGLQEASDFQSSASEVTVECNPESLTLAKARALREEGVTRLSIGLQSLEPRILELFDRPHEPEDAFRAYEAAREAGFEDVNLDVIYGVPGQELATWERDLERLLSVGPDHVSAYSLAFEPGTALTKDLESGRLERLPEEVELAFFEQTRARLEGAGLEAYEVSNFAMKDHRCRHNENYWSNGPYVGLGPGAVSKLGATRFGNPRSVPRWRASIASGAFPASWEETLSPLEELGQTWWLGLRTRDGIEPATARRTAGWSGEADPMEARARELASLGMLARENGRWSLTARGLPLADAVTARFLADPDPAASGQGRMGG